jgi:formate-dependent phosphoribosylglycinamide formyltransferase (GAR transformylase)
VSGERADTFNNSYSDGTAISGSLTEAVSTPVVVTAVLQSNGSYLVSDTGTIQVAYQATITQANGKSSAISDAATITLNGQETVHVDMGGIHISVDMTTGKTE